jgi:hypothetical protein
MQQPVPVDVPSIADIEAAIRRALGDRRISPWFDTPAAANYLSCESATLRTWRVKGGGPRYYVVHGKSIRYHVDDLEAFVRGESNR